MVRPPADASRYVAGHVSYLGYSALAEALAFIESVGVEALLAHSVALNRRVLEGLPPGRYECVSPHADRSPILTLRVPDPEALVLRLQEARIGVTLAGDRLRISPAIYNDEEDVERLLEVLAAPTA